MSSLLPDDGDMHYSNGAHRWVASAATQQEAWEERLRQHLDNHLKTMGGEGGSELHLSGMGQDPRSRRVPGPRTPKNVRRSLRGPEGLG